MEGAGQPEDYRDVLGAEQCGTLVVVVIANLCKNNQNVENDIFLEL